MIGLDPKYIKVVILLQHNSYTTTLASWTMIYGLCHLMTCGNNNWEPTSTQITVNAFQSNACKWRNRLCFLFVLFTVLLQIKSN